MDTNNAPAVVQVDPGQLAEMVGRAVAEALARRDAAKTPEERAVANAEVDFAQRIYNANASAEAQGFKPFERIGMQVLAFARAKGDHNEALRIIHNEFSAPAVSKQIQRALELKNPGAGGFLFPGENLDEVIPLLRPMAVLFRLGARMLPLVEGRATMPYVKTGSTAGWFAEGQTIGNTEPTFGQLELQAKNIGAYTYISQFMLRARGSNIYQVVGQDMLAAVAQEMSRAAWFGTANSNQPTGLFTAPLLSQLNNVTVNALPNYTSIPAMLTSFRKQNPPMINVRWVFGPDIWGQLMSAVSTTGEPMFRRELETGTLFGYPFEVDNQIPVQGGSYSKSYAILADWNEYFISEFQNMALETDNSLRFLQHQQAVKVVASADMGPRQPKAFTVTDDMYTSAT